MKNTVVRIAREEWQYFGEQEIAVDGSIVQKGRREHEPGYWERVGEYWRVGVRESLDGRDRDKPWSAAFISYVLRKAGAGKRFLYSGSHFRYIRDAVDDRKAGAKDAVFYAYPVEEVRPFVGDIVCYARQPGVTLETTEWYASHGDIVVAQSANEIQVIGGNVHHSVSLKHLAVDSNGLLVDQNHAWFAVLRNQIG